jgi:hypothetical protein
MHRVWLLGFVLETRANVKIWLIVMACQDPT